MGKVAFAGGSVGLGRAMVDALESVKAHEYIILSRRSSGSKIRQADYTNIEALTALLEFENIDTVISTIAINDDEAGQAQLNLIEAANRSSCTKRFLPSEFGMLYTRENINHVPSYQWKLQAVDRLEQTSLEFSLVSIGMFLDYWSSPRIPTRLAHAMNVWVDAENNVAVIPGDGETPVVLTHSSDAARYVVALLDEPWKRRHFIVGNRTTLNEAIRLAEEVKGVKFDVRYFSTEALQRGEVDLTPQMKAALPDEGMQSTLKAVLAASGLSLAKGDLDLNPDESLTLKFPSIKPLTLRDVWTAWK
ncbi:hypothetical protein ACHAPT_004768 [Fusarium lateritium]